MNRNELDELRMLVERQITSLNTILAAINRELSQPAPAQYESLEEILISAEPKHERRK